MAGMVRFPLIMANGAEVRSIDDLRENFDLKSVLNYYGNGKLVLWLRDHSEDTIADKIEALDKNSNAFSADLCAEFGIQLSEHSNEDNGTVDPERIKRRNEKCDF